MAATDAVDVMEVTPVVMAAVTDAMDTRATVVMDALEVAGATRVEAIEATAMVAQAGLVMPCHTGLAQAIRNLQPGQLDLPVTMPLVSTLIGR